MPICRYEVSKRFAFGGIYGASMSVEDVEGGLAKGVRKGLMTSCQ